MHYIYFLRSNIINDFSNVVLTFKNSIFFWLLFLCSSFGALTQNDLLFFDHLTHTNGLSSNRINVIQEDGEGFIWFGTGDGLNRYDGTTMEVFDKQVACMAINPKTKNLLIGTPKGLEIFDMNTWRFKPKKLKNKLGEKFGKGSINSMHFGSNNELFVGSDFLYIINESFTNFKKHPLPKDDNGREWEITSIQEVSENTILLGTKNGVYQLNLENGTYETVYKHENLGIISKLFIDSESNLWICTYFKGLYFVKDGNVKATPIIYEESDGFLINNRVVDIIEDEPQVFLIANIEGGLVRFDKKGNTISQYQPDIHEVSSISSKALTTLMKDSNDNVWIGTYNSGVDFIDRHRKDFEHYQVNFKENGLFNNNIRVLFQDSKGDIWVGTKEGGGLSKFNRADGTFVHYKPDPDNPVSLADDYVFCIEELDADHLMIGTLKNGLEIFNSVTGTFSHYMLNEYNSIYNMVYAIHKDQNDKIWVDYGGMFYEFFPEEGTIEKIDGILRVRCIIDEDESHIWLGTIETGLYLFNTKTKELEKTKINANQINALQKDSQGNLWIGTSIGLFLKKVNTTEFINYKVTDGLANNQVLSLQVDDADNIWASTINGLSKFDTKKQVFFNYDVHDGLQGNEFERYASLKTRDGELLFGGRNGFNIFNPDKITKNLEAPKVVITSFNLFNKPVTIGAEDSPLIKHISQTNDLTLTHQQSVITFGFVALNYSSPEKNHYAYKLEGFDKDWNYIENKRTATYTNLPAGNYVFKVKASNSDGLWNDSDASIQITVLHPWWKTRYAFLAYVVIIILLLAVFYYFLYMYLNLKNNLKLEQIEKQNNRELHQAKLEFFTNISHEFRTPLTLIISPLDKLLNSNISDANLLKHLKLMHSNANRLLRLINQLMDFRKVGKGKMTLKVAEYNIVEVTNEIARSFENKAEESSISYHVISVQPKIPVFLDIEKYEIILHNLLFNAFKFTKENGNISVEISLNNQLVEVRVIDDGKGISEAGIANVFEEFYQVEQDLSGTGIGLSLTKKIVELHKGTIRAESTLEKGSCFTISLRLGYEHFSTSDINEFQDAYPYITEAYNSNVLISKKQDAHTNLKQEKRPIKILLVEDNEDLRHYLKESLEKKYTIHEANDGVQGIAMCLKASPDLIISDVMMPNKSGVEMCFEIKNDIRISHIPVILLTARSSIEHKIEGLKSGADAYIEKPFNMELLEIKVSNLLETRKKLKLRFGNDIIIQPNEISNSSADDKFLNKAIKTIEEHFQDNTFGVDDFISEMAMSRSSLHIKLKALTNMSTTEFIRSIRLRKAAVFLKETDQTIAEIAYNTGFSSPEYFSRSFKKLFDKLPTDYRKE